MDKVKTFKIKQRFKGVEELYSYLLKHADFIGQSVGIQVQKPLHQKTFCIIGKEKITERQILFYASKQNFPESLGELIVFASAFDIDIVVFFLPNISNNYLMPLNWLQKICTADYEIIVMQAGF